MTTKTKATLKFGDLTIWYEKFNDENLPATLGDVLRSSDLKPGIYEGGFKIWECSIDLCRYLADHVELNSKRVLELGCGAGLPGIVALKEGACHVCFQDFNEEVLDSWTKVNVGLNQDNSDASAVSRCSFISGDWSDVQTALVNDGQKFDLVLASETIYSPSCYEKFLDIVDAVLAENGTALVAAKSYYFGVGGSVDDFLDFIKAGRSSRTARIVWTSRDAAISRHILLLQR